MEDNYNYKYNYVFFSNNKHEFYHIGHNPINGKVSVRYYDFPLCAESKFLRFLYRVHNSERIKKHIELPFKKVWNRILFREHFDNEKPICFVFSCETYYFCEVGFFEYLRKKYPDCKLMFLCTDKFDLIRQRYKMFDENYLRQAFDFILTYEVFDVKKYGLTYFQFFNPISKSSSLKVMETQNPIIKNDVVFVGEAKDRLPIILSVYDYLTNKGLVCDFYIAFAPQDVRQKYPGIQFGDSWIPYKDVIMKIKQSRCILDVVQGDSIGINARAIRAFEYNKKLISNCLGIKNCKLNDGRNVQFFDKVETINSDVIKNDSSPNYMFENLVSELSPYRYLDLIIQNETIPQIYYKQWIDLFELLK